MGAGPGVRFNGLKAGLGILAPLLTPRCRIARGGAAVRRRRRGMRQRGHQNSDAAVAEVNAPLTAVGEARKKRGIYGRWWLSWLAIPTLTVVGRHVDLGLLATTTRVAGLHGFCWSRGRKAGARGVNEYWRLQQWAIGSIHGGRCLSAVATRVGGQRGFSWSCRGGVGGACSHLRRRAFFSVTLWAVFARRLHSLRRSVRRAPAAGGKVGGTRYPRVLAGGAADRRRLGQIRRQDGAVDGR